MDCKTTVNRSFWHLVCAAHFAVNFKTHEKSFFSTYLGRKPNFIYYILPYETLEVVAFLMMQFKLCLCHQLLNKIWSLVCCRQDLNR